MLLLVFLTRIRCGAPLVYLRELVSDLRGVGVFAGFLFERNNHKILKEFSLLPFNELQLQRAVAGRPSKDGLQFQQPLGVS